MKEFIKRVLDEPRLYNFLTRIRPYLGKNLFLILCCIALIWYTIYTRTIISKLEMEAVTVTQTYAELIRAAISEHMNYEEMNVVFEEIIQKANYPIIITDSSWQPIMWKNVTKGPFWNPKPIPHDITDENIREYLAKKIQEYKKSYDPKTLYISETDIKLGYLVFGNSNLINSLSWMPFLEVGIIAAFFIFAYTAFHNIRVTERSNLWVGLAKETAHQLGTPISSLMGWVEYIRSTKDPFEPVDPEILVNQITSICDDMEYDLKRLRKVTARFSQIGSIPALAPCNINDALLDIMVYFKKRLPLLRKKIEICQYFSELPLVAVNRDLLEWVFENLIRNSIDAINKENGKIDIRTEYSEKEQVVKIFHGDNGKGISWEDQKRVFQPGFTTKKRGWGLGLTLAKRIIEDYHKGKIYICWSHKDKGTVFCIVLPVNPPTGKNHKAIKINQFKENPYGGDA